MREYIKELWRKMNRREREARSGGRFFGSCYLCAENSEAPAGRQVKHISLQGERLCFTKGCFELQVLQDRLPAFYYLWVSMNDSRVKWFLRAVDYEALSDGRYLSKKPGTLSGDKFIVLQNSQSRHDTLRDDRRGFRCLRLHYVI